MKPIMVRAVKGIKPRSNFDHWFYETHGYIVSRKEEGALFEQCHALETAAKEAREQYESAAAQRYCYDATRAAYSFGHRMVTK